MRGVLERTQRIERPREEVFAFFEDASNLERLTPPFLRFAILTKPPVHMAEGTLIDYRIALFGVPLRWQTRIEQYTPPERFVDAQLRGPYRAWRHTHELTCDGPDATWMRDRVDYELPMGPLGTLAHALFVRRTLARIFDFRRDAIAAIFPPPAL
ncbi:MAG: SRPBCC family protein [Myxococcales bacterium]|nr:SRPBCC family protein [Myxococcales bacterium]MBL0196144.1 SRPBCC family protein [Myxococcales bacterium]HQY65548.1 SRPBCC family protein [Polyangiaceae bacterium]